MADESINPMEELKFYQDSYIDQKGRMRDKTICIEKVVVECEDGGTEIYYAYGSTVRSVRDKFCELIGSNIAKQRAEKALERFGEMKYDFRFYNAHNGYEGCCGYKPWMNMLTPEEFGELEKRLLPEKPAEEKTDIAAFFDTADFSDKKEEKQDGVEIKADPDPNQEY